MPKKGTTDKKIITERIDKFFIFTPLLLC